MSNLLSRNVIKLVAFIALFLSFEVAFCGNDTIPSAPQTAEEWSDKGSVAHGNGDYDEAIKCFEKAIKLNSKYAEAYNNLGYAYAVGKENYEKAIKYYKKAIKLNRNYADAYLNLGRAYHRGKQNYDKAIKCYEKSIKLNPQNAKAYNNLGYTYVICKKDYDKVMEYCNKAIELDPNYAEPYCTLSLVYAMRGDVNKVTECLKEAAKLGNEGARLWMQRNNISW